MQMHFEIDDFPIQIIDYNYKFKFCRKVGFEAVLGLCVAEAALHAAPSPTPGYWLRLYCPGWLAVVAW